MKEIKRTPPDPTRPHQGSTRFHQVRQALWGTFRAWVSLGEIFLTIRPHQTQPGLKMTPPGLHKVPPGPTSLVRYFKGLVESGGQF